MVLYAESLRLSKFKLSLSWGFDNTVVALASAWNQFKARLTEHNKELLRQQIFDQI